VITKIVYYLTTIIIVLTTNPNSRTHKWLTNGNFTTELKRFWWILKPRITVHWRKTPCQLKTIPTLYIFMERN